jgi:hypothetical protein
MEFHMTKTELYSPTRHPKRVTKLLTAVVKVLSLSVLLMFPIPLVAQHGCSDILAQGVWGQSRTYSESERFAAFHNWFRSLQRDNKVTTRETGGGVDLLVEGIPVGGNLFSSRNEAEQFLRETESQTSQVLFGRDVFRRVEVAASSTIVDAWERCMEREAGLQFTADQTPQPGVYVVSVRFKDLPGGGRTSSIQNVIVPRSVTCDISFVGLNLNEQWRRSTCTVGDSSVATLVLSATVGHDVAVNLYPPMIKTPPPACNTQTWYYRQAWVSPCGSFAISINDVQYDNDGVPRVNVEIRLANGSLYLRTRERTECSFSSGNEFYRLTHVSSDIEHQRVALKVERAGSLIQPLCDTLTY